VARTIADLDASAAVAAEHLSEALAFRDTGLLPENPCPVDQD
jgi:predicted ATPase with chaperone activity